METSIDLLRQLSAHFEPTLAASGIAVIPFDDYSFSFGGKSDKAYVSFRAAAWGGDIEVWFGDENVSRSSPTRDIGVGLSVFRLLNERISNIHLPSPHDRIKLRADWDGSHDSAILIKIDNS